MALAALATPSNASFHQLYAGIPSRGTPELSNPNQSTADGSIPKWVIQEVSAD